MSSIIIVGRYKFDLKTVKGQFTVHLNILAIILYIQLLDFIKEKHKNLKTQKIRKQLATLQFRE